MNNHHGWPSSDQLAAKATELHLKGALYEAERLYVETLRLEESNQTALRNLATLYKSKGDLAKSEELFTQLIGIYPFDFVALHNYANLKSKTGDLRAVVELEMQAIRLNPREISQYLTLSEALRRLGRFDDAIEVLRQAETLDPGNPLVHLNLASNLHALGSIRQARSTLEHSLKTNGENISLYCALASLLKETGYTNDAHKVICQGIRRTGVETSESLSILAGILVQLGRVEEAASIALRAVQVNGGNSEAYTTLASVRLVQGQRRDATRLAREAIEKDRLNVHAFFILSLISGEKDRIHLIREINAIEEEEETIDQLGRIQLCFAKANILHKNKEFQEAARYLTIANKEKYKRYGSDLDQEIDSADKAMTASTLLSSRQDGGQNEVAFWPIFIVGMPRSGSTLTESVLGMNKDAITLGETNAFQLAYQRWAARDKADTVSRLQDYYFEYIFSKGSRQGTTIDKCLANYLYCGAICTQISAAKIIHCIRHPLDNILSMYRANFESGYRYASSITDCAHAYIKHERVMSTYKRDYPDRILTLEYEELVREPEKCIPMLIAWLGWEWEEDYLKPEKSTRDILTASLVQARSPISSGSVGVWKHYRTLLEPAMRIFEEDEILRTRLVDL